MALFKTVFAKAETKKSTSKKLKLFFTCEIIFWIGFAVFLSAKQNFLFRPRELRFCCLFKPFPFVRKLGFARPNL